MDQRGSGILLHLTSLYTQYGIGDMGPAAYQWIDFLHRTKQSYWQILPLNPTDSSYDNCPYHSLSAFAMNPILISPQQLVDQGLLELSDIPAPSVIYQNKRYVDYRYITQFKKALLDRAFIAFMKRNKKVDYNNWCFDNSYWLDDFAIFSAIREYFNGKLWTEWPEH
jgi:4-alpha-glucanotransferase